MFSQLSHSLSHFSLSQTSPDTAPFPSDMTKARPQVLQFPATPPGARRPSAYPATAPISQSSFLGSPFSSRAQTRTYATTAQPDTRNEWDGREWMMDVVVDDADSDNETRRSGHRLRRDTSGSSSSVASGDEHAGSVASSASLMSLARSSEDHRIRPGVTIWGELDRPPSGRRSCDTESDYEGDAQLSISITKKNPPASRWKSPFSNFIPRLVPSGRRKITPTQSFATQGDDDATDTEEPSPSGRPFESCSTVCPSPPGRAMLLGLGISSAMPMARSLSSESGGVASPSKPPSGHRPPNPRRRTAAPTLEEPHPTKMMSSRPFLRRGITEPREQMSRNQDLLFPGPHAFATPPPLFSDIKPSPAAFASTGLIKKRSGLPNVEIPQFGPIAPSVALPPQVPKGRGLRRKGSTMFSASGSSGSIGGMTGMQDVQASPVTPTKHAVQSEFAFSY